MYGIKTKQQVWVIEADYSKLEQRIAAQMMGQYAKQDAGATWKMQEARARVNKEDKALLAVEQDLRDQGLVPVIRSFGRFLRTVRRSGVRVELCTSFMYNRNRRKKVIWIPAWSYLLCLRNMQAFYQPKDKKALRTVKKTLKKLVKNPMQRVVFLTELLMKERDTRVEEWENSETFPLAGSPDFELGRCLDKANEELEVRKWDGR